MLQSLANILLTCPLFLGIFVSMDPKIDQEDEVSFKPSSNLLCVQLTAVLVMTVIETKAMKLMIKILTFIPTDNWNSNLQ